TLNTGQFDPDFCRRDLLARNPLAWMIEVNGLVVDARILPPELQAEARRRGLIPDLDALGRAVRTRNACPAARGPGLRLMVNSLALHEHRQRQRVASVA